MPDPEHAEIAQLLEDWKKTVDVQMHFNDLIMRNRQIIMTAVIAVFGAAAFSLQFSNLMLEVCTFRFHAAAAIILFALALLVSMFLLDYYYYFRLLLAAVKRGKELERLLQSRSSNQLASLTLVISGAVKRDKAERLLRWFYLIPFITGLLFFTFVLFGYRPFAGKV